jgi:hypothetical protein
VPAFSVIAKSVVSSDSQSGVPVGVNRRSDVTDFNRLRVNGFQIELTQIYGSREKDAVNGCATLGMQGNAIGSYCICWMEPVTFLVIITALGRISVSGVSSS